jgi:stress response protein SCP2
VNLSKGANTIVGDADLGSLVLAVRWQSGGPTYDVCAIICGDDRRSLSDQHFLFWDNRAAPSRAVFLRERTEPSNEDRGQVLVDVSGLEAAASRIIVSLSTVDDGATMASARGIVIDAVNPRNGEVVASFALEDAVRPETCLVLAELYRHNNAWKLRAIGQGYDTGLAGLGRDYGVAIA